MVFSNDQSGLFSYILYIYDGGHLGFGLINLQLTGLHLLYREVHSACTGVMSVQQEVLQLGSGPTVFRLPKGSRPPPFVFQDRFGCSTLCLVISSYNWTAENRSNEKSTTSTAEPGPPLSPLYPGSRSLVMIQTL